MVNSSNHWAYEIAKTLQESYSGKIICASGISPSGNIHVGNLREVMTTQFVYKALISQNADAEFILSWDDFDRFRKVPHGMPDSLQSEVGKPLSKVTDPSGEYDSYATRFITNFQNSLSELGINPRFIRQSEMYQNGAYDEKIVEALHGRKSIAKILAHNMSQGMSDEQIENYFPLSVYSRFTGNDNTRVVSFDGTSKVEYICHETGKNDIIDITEDRVVKLPWKIDWCMRWQHEGVNFEPGGHDHASPGSSYVVASQIAKEFFGFKEPDFQEYGFIRIKGQKGKMSSSTGAVITPNELLNVYPAEMIKWLYAKSTPTSQIDIALDKDVMRAYAEFDRALSEDVVAGLSDLIDADSSSSNPLPFRTAFGLGESTGYNLEKVRSILAQSEQDFDADSVSERLEKSNFWSAKYFPEGRSELLLDRNESYLGSLPADELNQLHQLKTVIESKGQNIDDLEATLYSIPKKEGMSDSEKKAAQKKFFKNTYNALFGKNQGPRLPTFIWAQDNPEAVSKLLEP